MLCVCEVMFVSGLLFVVLLIVCVLVNFIDMFVVLLNVFMFVFV